MQSAIVDDDGSVTFRIRAAEANSVRLVGNDMPEVGQGLPLEKKEENIWEIKVGPTQPGTYRYRFNLDGVNVNDPANGLVSESNGNTWSMVHVPGASWMDSGEVDHGAIAEVTYHSKSLQRDRRMHVYTPPGYEADSQAKYPVFYLLHGASDCDDSWSSVGRAGYILDNLIAAGNAEPMIVVMPAGHTGPFRSGRNAIPVDEFTLDFEGDIVPYVESHYRVKDGRANRAIAGLSMGGAQTLNVAIRNLDRYGFVGVFSSGVFGINGQGRGGNNGPPWEEQHKEVLDNEQLKMGLKLVWFATGKDDFLIETSRSTVEALKKHNFEVTYKETAGGHTWINWREYLHEFAQHLFRDNVTPVALDVAKDAAVGVEGVWQSEFETQIGTQKYVFILKAVDGQITGTATADIADEKVESVIVEGSIDGNKVQFVEELSFQGNELRIQYSGILAENELQLDRKVGDFAEEKLLATRGKP